MFCSLSIRAAVMSCPESELSAQALPSSHVATQPNTSSEAKTKKTFIAHVLVGNLFFRFVEPMSLPSVDLNHLGGLTSGMTLAVKFALKGRGLTLGTKALQELQGHRRGFCCFFLHQIKEEVEYLTYTYSTSLNMTLPI